MAHSCGHTCCDPAVNPFCAGTAGDDPVTDLRWDFEDGTLQGFEKDSGDCGTMPQRYDSYGYMQSPEGGSVYVVNTYAGDHPYQCVYSDRSHPFRITETTSITWLGTAGKSSRLSLVSVATEQVVLSWQWDEQTWTLAAKEWSGDDLVSLLGEEVFLQFADEGSGLWEQIVLDNIAVRSGIRSSSVALLCIAVLAGL